MRERIMDALRNAGIDGLDEEMLEDRLDLDEGNGDEVSGAIRELRAEGEIEDVGCSWLRLSPRAWAREIVDDMRENGRCGADVAERIEAILRGETQSVLRLAKA